MRTISINFINFWPGFEINAWFNHWKQAYTHPQINWELSTDENTDLLVSSVFGSINNINNYKCPKILYTRENLDFAHYYQFKNNLSLFNLIIGFNTKDHEIDVPWYYDMMHLLNINSFCLNQDFLNRKPLTLINRNPQILRLKLLSSFNTKRYVVDCPGPVGKNMEIIIVNGWDKIDFIKNYYFNICPENSYADGYITERLFECCIAGSIPIYYGCERLNDGFYNKNRILHISQDLSNYDQIIDKTIYLLNHKNELIEFMNQNPFTIDYKNYIENIKLRIRNSLESLLLN